MLKNMLLLLAVVGSVNCMAAYQYGINIEKENEYVTAGLDSKVGWTVTAKQDIVLSLSGDVNLLRSVNIHMNNVLDTFTPQYTALGYVRFDAATGAILSVESLNLNDSVDSISLKAGESIGFWVTVDGVTSSSVRGMEGYNYGVFGGGDNGNGSKVYNFVTYKNKDNYIYGYEQSILFGVEAAGSNSSPSGQPLPGVLAGLLIGGAALGLARRRKK